MNGGAACSISAWHLLTLLKCCDGCTSSANARIAERKFVIWSSSPVGFPTVRGARRSSSCLMRPRVSRGWRVEALWRSVQAGLEWGELELDWVGWAL